MRTTEIGAWTPPTGRMFGRRGAVRRMTVPPMASRKRALGLPTSSESGCDDPPALLLLSMADAGVPSTAPSPDFVERAGATPMSPTPDFMETVGEAPAPTDLPTERGAGEIVAALIPRPVRRTAWAARWMTAFWVRRRLARLKS